MRFFPVDSSEPEVPAAAPHTHLILALSLGDRDLTLGPSDPLGTSARSLAVRWAYGSIHLSCWDLKLGPESFSGRNDRRSRLASLLLSLSNIEFSHSRSCPSCCNLQVVSDLRKVSLHLLPVTVVNSYSAIDLSRLAH